MSASEPIPTASTQRAPSAIDVALRVFAGAMVVCGLVFLLDNYLTYWREWPGVVRLYHHYGWFGLERSALDAAAVPLGWTQLALYAVPVAAFACWTVSTPRRSLHRDADWMSGLAAWIIRAAFWATLLIGVADMLISFLRVEGFLAALVGDALTTQLGRPSYRGTFVHYPLAAVALVIALFTRSLGFIWLALLVVLAEFQIVVSRFVFSYEQAFMGDLVRFWYAALFLFASAYTLVEDGHVRVDVFYARFTERGKAWTNVCGSVFLGMPLCWTILTQGMWSRTDSLNSPLLSFEISQSGFGMYTKYLMAGFLVIFAISMLVQFASYFLANAAVLRGDRLNPPARMEG